MIVVCATMRAKTGKEDELVDNMRKLAAEVREKEKGALDYTFHRSSKDPGLFMVYEKYESGEAMREHISSGHFQEAAKKLPELLEGGLTLETYEVVS